jgi:hypothetical protein
MPNLLGTLRYAVRQFRLSRVFALHTSFAILDLQAAVGF